MEMLIDILDYVPKEFTPSEQQISILRAYEALSDKVQVVCLNVPVAGGKSLLLCTIGAYENAKHEGGATLVAPTNQLVSQLHKTGKSSGYAVAPYKFADRKTTWEVAKKQFQKTPLKVCNVMSYLANRAYSRCLLWDEAHTARSILQDMEGLKLWYHLTPWPLNIVTVDQFLYWLASEGDDEPSLKKARKLLSRDPTSYILEQETASYKGQDQICLKVVPLTPKNNRPIFWPPSKVKRIVLASATLSREDLADIGLDKKYTAWLSAPSRIPKERRPLVYSPCAYPVYDRPEEIPKLAEGILDVAHYHSGEKGLVHVTYAMSALLRPLLSKDTRFIFHTKENKLAAFNRWQATPDGILLASGMHEGVDLKYDMCRWQIIAKAVWPSLADAAVKLKAEQRPDWYIWETLKIMMQAYGRVCRMPDDYGVTYILTAEWKRLIKEAIDKNLVPEWFSEALIT
jgi:hypothetical protein